MTAATSAGAALALAVAMGPLTPAGPLAPPARVALVAVEAADAEGPPPFSLPVPGGSVDRRGLGAPHHDYPAADLMVPSGTPVFAVAEGVVQVHRGQRCGWGVTLTRPDGTRFVYCHLRSVSFRAGGRADPGDVLGLSGDTGNARGVPHLHFHVRDRSGRHVCPQPMLLAWHEGRSPRPAEWRRTRGCSFPRAPRPVPQVAKAAP